MMDNDFPDHVHDPIEDHVILAMTYNKELAKRAPQLTRGSWGTRSMFVMYRVCRQWGLSDAEGHGALFDMLNAEDRSTKWHVIFARLNNLARFGVEDEFDENINILIARASKSAGQALQVEASRAALDGNYREAARLSMLAADAYLQADPRARSGTVEIGEAASSLLSRVESGVPLVGPAVGLAYFDDVENWYGKMAFAPGKMTVIAARPSHGKTAILLQMLANAALETAVAMWSCEMDPEDLLIRMAASKAGLNSMRITTGKLNSDELRRLRDALGYLSDLPILFSKSAKATMATISAMVDECETKFGGCGIASIDYLQKLRPIGRHDSHALAIGEISTDCKALARDRGLCALVLSQLNRAVEGRQDRTPQMSDLRASGDIEQDADHIFFLDRPSMWNDAAPKHLAILRCAKFRNGVAPSRIDLDFDGPTQVFSDVDY